MATDCIEWAKYRNKLGYGVRTVGSRTDGTRRTVLAHRWVWEQVHGPVTEPLCVLHRCDNPACINLEHLFIGTRVVNNEDRNKKGRNRGLEHLHFANLIRFIQAEEHDPRTLMGGTPNDTC